MKSCILSLMSLVAFIAHLWLWECAPLWVIFWALSMIFAAAAIFRGQKEFSCGSAESCHKGSMISSVLSLMIVFLLAFSVYMMKAMPHAVAFGTKAS